MALITEIMDTFVQCTGALPQEPINQAATIAKEKECRK